MKNITEIQKSIEQFILSTIIDRESRAFLFTQYSLEFDNEASAELFNQTLLELERTGLLGIDSDHASEGGWFHITKEGKEYAQLIFPEPEVEVAI